MTCVGIVLGIMIVLGIGYVLVQRWFSELPYPFGRGRK